MKDHAGSDAVVEADGIGEGEKVTCANVEVLSDAVANADQTLEIYITIVRAVERGGSGDFEVEMQHAGGAAVSVCVVVTCVVFSEGFH